MRLEFVTDRNFNVDEAFAEKFGVQAEDNRVDFSGDIGRGFIKRLQLGPGLQLLLNRFCLKEELIIRRQPIAGNGDLVSVVFYLHDKPVIFLKGPGGETDPGIQLSSIHVTSTNLEMETHFGAETNVHCTIVVFPIDFMVELLQTKKESPILREINSEAESFWFDSEMTLEIQNVLKQIDHAYEGGLFDEPFYRLKAQELIYLLFTELLREEKRQFQKINNEDIQKAYLVRNMLLSDLSSQPTIAGLAKMVCVSESKLKQLYRQVFGKSIYNSYQIARMNEAAALLKELTVTETGYKLGFVSMSHFSQLFKKYQGVTPQKFRNLVKPKNGIALEQVF